MTLVSTDALLGTEKYDDEHAHQTFLSILMVAVVMHTPARNILSTTLMSSPHIWSPLSIVSVHSSSVLSSLHPCVDLELNAVHSEHSKNLLQRNWRLFQLLKTTSNPKSPFSKFGTVSHATLRDGPKENGIDVREALMKFHADHYSAHRMRLVVVGSDGLDELQQMVVSKFNNVKSNSNPPHHRSPQMPCDLVMTWAG